MNTQFELILFNKYLIRTDRYNYILSIVKDNCEPIIKNKVINNKNTKDFSNFTDDTYHNTFGDTLKKIKELEIRMSNVNTINDLITVLNNIDNKIDEIKKKLV